MKHPEVVNGLQGSFEVDPVSTTELGTAIHPEALEDPPTSANEYVVDLLGCFTRITVPCSTMWL